MSRTVSPSNVPAGKPRANLYTVLLVIALLALIVGTVFMYIESTNTGGRGVGAARPTAGPAIASAPIVA